MSRSTAGKRAVKLRGKKASLGPVEKSDARPYHKWINDIEISKFLTAGPWIITFQDELDFINKIRKDTQRKVFSILTRTGKLIGNCSLDAIDLTNRTATLGILIGDKNYWGRGYGTESVRLLLEYGFNILNLKNIMLTVNSDNIRAIRCYQTAGFRKIGKRRKSRYYSGDYSDVIYMDILDEDFRRDASGAGKRKRVNKVKQ